jgi:hypothetical protein
MLSMWSRAVCALAVCGCYNPSPVEELACSETDRCPDGQRCDLAFHRCAAFPICAAPQIVDDFAGAAPPCEPWGVQFGNATVTVADHALAITPAANRPNGGGCVASAPIDFADGGIFLEAVAVMPPGRGFLGLAAQASGTALSLVARDGVLALTLPDAVLASAPYDATAMRWWRLRPDRTAATVAEYAADGSHWTRLGSLDEPPPAQITIELSAGVDAPEAAPPTARIAHLGVCPPSP